MKKIILFISVFAFFVSCNDDIEVDIKYQTEITINNMAVVENLKNPINNEYLFPDGELNEEDFKVRVSTLIYDSLGVLVDENIQIVDNFSTNVSLTNALPKGNYTLVVCTDIVEMNDGEVSFEMWSIQNKSSINSLKINDLDESIFKFKVLGVTKTNLNIEKAGLFQVNTEPVGAMITYYFTNIDNSKVAAFEYTSFYKNDYYSVDKGEYAIEDNNSTDPYECDEIHTGLYTFRFYFPMEEQGLWIDTYSPTGTNLLSGYLTFSVEIGVNKLIELDVQTGKYSITETSTSTKSALKREDLSVIKSATSASIKNRRIN